MVHIRIHTPDGGWVTLASEDAPARILAALASVPAEVSWYAEDGVGYRDETPALGQYERWLEEHERAAIPTEVDGVAVHPVSTVRSGRVTLLPDVWEDDPPDSRVWEYDIATGETRRADETAALAGEEAGRGT